MRETIEIEKEFINCLNELHQENRIPEINISDNEWESFFSIIHIYLSQKDKLNDFQGVLHVILQRSTIQTLINKPETFTIDDLLYGINDISCFGFNRSEILRMKQRIKNKSEYLNKQDKSKFKKLNKILFD